MGVFTSDGSLDLQPINPPLGVNLAFTSHPLSTLVLREQLFKWSGDDFTVTDQAGIPIVTCSGKAISLQGRKEIVTPDGEHMFTLREKTISLRRSFRGEDRNGNVLFEIKKRVGFGAKMQITFTNAATKQPVTLLLQGDLWGCTADIVVEDGPPVAQIKRDPINARSLVFGQQTYFVNVAPGVDLALIAAICICLDEIKNEKSKPYYWSPRQAKSL